MTQFSTKEEILEEIKDILGKNQGIEYEDIKLESKLSDDLGLDSLDKLDFSMSLESSFNISIDDDNKIIYQENITIDDVINEVMILVKPS